MGFFAKPKLRGLRECFFNFMVPLSSRVKHKNILPYGKWRKDDGQEKERRGGGGELPPGMCLPPCLSNTPPSPPCSWSDTNYSIAVTSTTKTCNLSHAWYFVIFKTEIINSSNLIRIKLQRQKICNISGLTTKQNKKQLQMSDTIWQFVWTEFKLFTEQCSDSSW